MLTFEIFGRARNHGKKVPKIVSDLLQRYRPFLQTDILYLTYPVHTFNYKPAVLFLLRRRIQFLSPLKARSYKPFQTVRTTAMNSTYGIVQHGLYLHMHDTSYLDLLRVPPYKLTGSSLSAYRVRHEQVRILPFCLTRLEFCIINSLPV